MLTTGERLGFETAGFTVLGRACTSGELDAMNQEAVKILGLAGATAWPEDHLMRADEPDRHVRVALHVSHFNDVFRAYTLNPSVLAAVADLFGCEPAVLTSLLFYKPPRVGEPLEPHQDLPYYPYLGADDLITCWTALTEVNEANGCIRYLAGSHRATMAHRATGGQQALEIEPAELEGFPEVAVPLAPGECCLHHGLTAHHSGANRSRQPRIGLAVLYVAGDAEVTLEDFAYPLLRAGSA